MRLTKIQKALKAKGIPYDYRENDGFGDIMFNYGGKRHSVGEYVEGRGATPTGIIMFINGRSTCATQDGIVEYIDEL